MNDAKNSFSELMSLAPNKGAQRVKQHNKDFKDYLLSPPDKSNLDLGRDKSSMRDVCL